MTKPDQPSAFPKTVEPSREDRLAKALRENLRRRKAAPVPATQPNKDPD